MYWPLEIEVITTNMLFRAQITVTVEHANYSNFVQLLLLLFKHSLLFNKLLLSQYSRVTIVDDSSYLI